MIKSSPVLMVGTVAVSVAAHSLLGWTVLTRETPQTKGGSEGTIAAQLGTSFEDVAVGTLVPQKTAKHSEQPDTTTFQPTDVKEQIQPLKVNGPVSTVTAVVTAEKAKPDKVTSLAAVPPKTLSENPSMPVAPQSTASRTPISPDKARAASTAPMLPTILAALPTVNEVVKSDVPETASTSAEKTLDALSRPRARPTSRAPSLAGKKERTSLRGNGQRAATVGNTQRARVAAPSQNSSGAQRDKTSGTATTSNYRGLVLQEISRVRKPRDAGIGTAVVSFSIRVSGGLASVSIARSSGSPRLDRAALKVIRKAAPFPKPPPGAKRVFQVKITLQG